MTMKLGNDNAADPINLRARAADTTSTRHPPKKTSNTNASQLKTAKSVPPPEADLIDMAFTKQTLQATPTSAMTLITHRIYTHKNLHHDRAHYSDALLNRLSNRRTCSEEQLRSPRWPHRCTWDMHIWQLPTF